MFVIDTDEAHRQTQDLAAIELNLDGMQDGYLGNDTCSSEFPYLKGFIEGMKRRNAEMVEQIQYLKEMSRRTDEIVAGECEWLNEIMQNNDEPWLADESMIEEF